MSDLTVCPKCSRRVGAPSNLVQIVGQEVRGGSVTIWQFRRICANCGWHDVELCYKGNPAHESRCDRFFETIRRVTEEMERLATGHILGFVPDFPEGI